MTLHERIRLQAQDVLDGFWDRLQAADEQRMQRLNLICALDRCGICQRVLREHNRNRSRCWQHRRL